MKKNRQSTVYKKGEILEFDIIDLGNEGEGIGKTASFTWFVKDAVIGDRVRAAVMKCMKNYGYAKLESIIKPSSYRIAPKCSVAKPCGGCTMQSISYKSQLKYKENKVLNNLIRIGGFKAEDFIFENALEKIPKYEEVIGCEPDKAYSGKNLGSGKDAGGKCRFYSIIGMEKPWRYRNKAIIPIGEKNGRLIAGFYAGRTHSIIESGDCLIGIEENSEIINTVLAFMKAFNISAYDEATGRGLIRHILIRKGFSTGEIMVCIVINGKSLPHSEKLCRDLRAIKGIKSIMLNINCERTNIILGLKSLNLYGMNYISDYIGAIKFNISVESFYQVNPMQTVKLYNKALEFTRLNGSEVVWDLYCGIGTISLFLAQRAGKVYGIETVAQAIEDAKANARINHIENAEFIVGNVEDILTKWYKESGEKKRKDSNEYIRSVDVESGKNINEKENLNKKNISIELPDVVVVDPPRRGCDIKCLEVMVAASPEKIVYVSCDSATLARDLKCIVERGYRLSEVQTVDMFPWSSHVETVALLSKLNVDKHISVEIELDELDLTSAESKASYAQIKEYILEKFDLKVSTLYIAQIKKKCGIVLRENYNKSKKEKQVIPQCTPEKEEAIMDALRHFKMI